MSNEVTLLCGDCLQEYTATTPCMCSKRVNEVVETVSFGTFSRPYIAADKLSGWEKAPEWPSAEESAKPKHYRVFAIGPLKQLRCPDLMPEFKPPTISDMVKMLWPDVKLTEQQLKVLEQIEANPDANVVLTPHVHDESYVSINVVELKRALGILGVPNSNAQKLPAKDWIG